MFVLVDPTKLESDSEESSSSEESESEEEEYDGDLNDDLDDALSGDFSFTGSYYHRSVEPNAPNPGLTIEGLGLVGLPLSERDAHAIISRAAQAPFGKGLHTVVDNAVRDTWEIDPRSISFANPAWAAFVDQVAMKKVWTTLGLAPYTTKPRCELYKLLLYQKGSHFRAHQGRPTSCYSLWRTTVLDVSQGSFFNTSVLAWYTDVIHEVKPITSGYRLALSYNLIHTSPKVPLPSLPSAPQEALEDLSKTFQRWRDHRYPWESLPDPPLFAALLSHQYSKNDLDRGVEALKGKDANLVSHLLPIAEESQIVVCIANLKKTVRGSADEDSGCSYAFHKRRRHGYYDEYDRESTPDMGEVEEESLELSNVVRIGANEALNLGARNHDMTVESLVPRDAFDGIRPDKSEYDNYTGSMEQFYHRSALVLFRKDDEISIIMQLSGPDAVRRTISLTNMPTPAVKKAISAILRSCPSSETTLEMLQYALTWREYEIWNEAIPSLKTVEQIVRALDDATKVFPLAWLQPGLSNLVGRQSGLQTGLDVTNAVALYFEGGIKSEWAQSIIKHMLSSYRSVLVADVPILVQLAHDEWFDGGIETLASIIVPQTRKEVGSYDFHIALTEALLKRKDLLATSHPQLFSSLIDQCLLAAASHWTISLGNKNIYEFRRPTIVETPPVLAQRAGKLVNLCVSRNKAELCTEIFKITGTEHRMDLLIAIKSNMNGGSHLWVEDMMKTAVSEYSTPTLSHVSILSWIAGIIGPDHIQNLVVKTLAKSATYEFLVALAKSLQDRRNALSQRQDIAETLKAGFQTTISRLLLSAISKWEENLTTPTQPTRNLYGPPQVPKDTKAKRIVELVELVDLCLIVGDLHPCVVLFNDLLKIGSTATVAPKFREIFIPLVPNLKRVLTKHRKDITLEPFRTFFKHLISYYLAYILSATSSRPPEIPQLPASTVIGCGCVHCQRLNNWLHKSTKKIEFKAIQSIRLHVEGVIAQTRYTWVTHTTQCSGSPYTLILSKRIPVMPGPTWQQAQSGAWAFMRSIADTDKKLKEVMQEQLENAMSAVNGEKTFVIQKTPASSSQVPTAPSSSVPRPSASTSATAPRPLTSTSVATPRPSTSGATQIAGAKRKRPGHLPTNFMDMIDLT